MLSRAIKLSPILLLTLNLWAGCCCVGLSCGTEPSTCAGNTDKTEQTSTQASCHATPSSATAVDAQHEATTQLVDRACQCGNHQKVQGEFFALPNFKEVSVAAPLIPFSYYRVAPVQAPEQSLYSNIFTGGPVSDRLAPRLSVLARFQI